MNDSDKTQILVALINSGQIQLPYQRLIRDVIERFSKKSLQTTDEKGRELTIEELSQKRRKFLLTAAKLDAEYLHLFWRGLDELDKETSCDEWNFPVEINQFLSLFERYQK